jgi:Trk K+ transport system NAD-binding subunit
MGLITLVGVVTIFASTYLILYSEPLYRLFAQPLKLFERRNPYREAAFDTPEGIPSVDVILVGLGNYGSGVAEYLLRRHKVILGVDFDPVALERWVARGISVLYGDVADPELHEYLPLSKARWVVSTVRSKALNLALLQYLKMRGYGGKIALTAANQEEANAFEKTGACVVLRPFADAAEQAADALTYAMDFLPANLNWPISFREVRIQSDASVAGKKIKDIPLRSETGVSILAVSRAGRVYDDLHPDYQLYPGDRLIIMGSVEELRQAETLLRQLQRSDSAEEDSGHFVVAEICIAEHSGLVGQTLAEARFRQRHGVTVAGIRRDENQMMMPTPMERLSVNDCLIVIGNPEAVDGLKQRDPL